MTGPLPASVELPDAVEILRCQLCGGDGHRTKFRDGPFSVRECTACGLVYVTPRLSGEALAKVYGEGYWKSDNPKSRGYADYAREASLYLKTFQRRMALVRDWIPQGGRVLDVGCAAGYFMQVMREHGHKVLGVEPSAAIATIARQELGEHAVFVGDLADAPQELGYRDGAFDLITLWDVIEHIPDPQATLRRLRAMLAPGGRLLLETQNVNSRWARLLGRRWHHYKHEEHLYHFRPETIRRLLQDCGFRVLHLGAGHAGKYVSLAFIAERAGRLGRVAGALASPLRLLGSCNLYVNPRDEMIVVAEPGGA
ncbi:MAG: class I SAM-dependent methyltransferase [Planctomycetota bacterium]